MSVTVHQSPPTFSPSDNPIIWEFSSNQTAQANFSFVIEVYINDVLDSRHEVFPQVGSRSHFDVSIVTKRTAPVATIQQTTVGKNAANWVYAKINIRERYGTTPAYGAAFMASNCVAFKSSLTPEERSVWVWQDYTVLGGANPTKFLTDNTNALTIPLDKDYFISFFNLGESAIEITFVLYDSDGNSISGSDVAIDDSWIIIQLNLRSSFLIAETGLTQAMFDQAAYAEFFLTQSGGDAISEVVRIYYDHDDCGTKTHCVWLNRFSSFDCYTFQHNAIYSGTIESKDYGKQFGGWVGTSYVLDAQNSGQIDYLKQTKKKVQLVSGFIDQDIQRYLVRSMYSSPLCYISGASFIRVRIEATAYEEQNDDFEEEFTEIVDLSFPNAANSPIL